MMNSTLKFIVNRPLTTIIIMMVICIIAILGVRELHLSTDYRVYFSEDNPQLNAFERIENTYSRNDNVFFVLAPKNKDIFTHKNIEALQWLTDQSWLLPFSIRVDSINNFQHSNALGDDIEVGNLVPRLNYDNRTKELDKYRKIATAEPLLRNRLISPDGSVTGINVRFQLPDENGGTALSEVAIAAYKLRDELLIKYPQMDCYITGFIIMNYAMPKTSQEDMEVLFPLMLVVITLMMFALFSCWKITACIMVTLLITIASAMGVAGWLGIVLTPPTMAAPVVILTLGVADSVHILLGYRAANLEGNIKSESMLISLRSNFWPIFLTSLTTSLGFLSMNLSDSPPFRDLGNVTFMGIWIAMLLSLTLLPAITVKVSSLVKDTLIFERVGSFSFRRLAHWVYRWANLLLIGNFLVFIMLSLFLTKNELNDEFVKYVSEKVDFRISTEFAAKNLSGIYTIEYSLDSGEVSGISDPEYLRNVQKLVEWLRAQSEIAHVASLTDIFKRLNKNMNGDMPEYFILPTEKNIAAQYLLLFEMSLPVGLGLSDQINLDKSAMRITITLKDNYSTNEYLALEQRIDHWMLLNSPSIRSVATSPTMMFTHIGKRNILSMLLSTGLATVVISIILIIAFRSLRIGGLCILPNIAPGIMGFGFWGLINGNVGLALSMVACLTMGIVVDNTIHFITKYLYCRRTLNYSIEEALVYTFERLGVVVLSTNFILIFGFSILIFSDFTPNSEMGLLTCITLFFAFITDLLFLPALLVKFDRMKISSKHPTSIDNTPLSK